MWVSQVATVSSPSVSIPIPEGDPSDIEEEEEFTEQNDTSGTSQT